MLKIGITGGIGTGKTTVCKIFELLGVPVFYADEVAKRLTVSDPILISQITEQFGKQSYNEDHTLNTKYISNLVFNDVQLLNKLNSFVHPAVFKAMDTWSQQQKAAYVIKEAALLFESKSYLQNDFNILVSTPLELRIKRVMLRDDVSKEKVLERIANQMDEEEKKKLADYFIENNESSFLIPQVISLHQEFLKRSNI